jgi:hypothetical protein
MRARVRIPVHILDPSPNLLGYYFDVEAAMIAIILAGRMVVR